MAHILERRENRELKLVRAEIIEPDGWFREFFDARMCDDRVAHDPGHPEFSISFGGEAFFIIGLHPQASRPARRFERPTMIFNLHDQFEKLREEGQYDRLRASILDRDVKIAGDINPMLAQHGEVSAARQYSGRAVGAEWKCPYARAGRQPDMELNNVLND